MCIAIALAALAASCARESSATSSQPAASSGDPCSLLLDLMNRRQLDASDGRLATLTRSQLDKELTEDEATLAALEPAMHDGLANELAFLVEVSRAFHSRFISEWPASGDARELGAIAAKSGYANVLVFLGRDGVDVSGQHLTFEGYAHRLALAVATAAYRCEHSRE